MRLLLFCSCFVLLPTLFGGCAASGPRDPWVDPRPLGREMPAYHAPRPGEDTTEPGGAAAQRAATGELTLRQALAAALMGNPALRGFAWQLRAAQARVLQAGLWPNPELAVEAENFGGSGAFSGLSAVETTALISQPISTGGKIAKRTRLARLQARLAAWDYEAKRLDVFTEVAQRFIGVLAAQRRLAVAKQTFSVAQQVYRTVGIQVQAGAVSPIEQTRAEAEQALNRVDLRRAERDLETARIALSEVLGLPKPTFDKVTGKLNAVRPIPPLAVLRDPFAQNPDVARWQTVLDARTAALELAEAQGMPDVTVGAGVRRFRATGDTAGVLSLSVPLPLFDRNQGNIQAARAELLQAQQQRRAEILRLRSALGQRYQDLQTALDTVTALTEQALPAARSAYRAIRTAYQRGERGFLDVLFAQRTLFDIKARQVEARADYHRTVAAVERLIGRPLWVEGR